MYSKLAGMNEHTKRSFKNEDTPRMGKRMCTNGIIQDEEQDNTEFCTSAKLQWTKTSRNGIKSRNKATR